MNIVKKNIILGISLLLLADCANNDNNKEKDCKLGCAMVTAFFHTTIETNNKNACSSSATSQSYQSCIFNAGTTATQLTAPFQNACNKKCKK